MTTLSTTWLQRLRKDPFRVFFPLGMIFGLWAPLTWILFVFFSSSSYPGNWHAELMFGGFFLLHIVGFLATAIPRFTETEQLSSIELLVFVIAALALIASATFLSPTVYFAVASGLVLLLIRFAASRFLRRQNNPPHTFIFVGLGLVLGWLGFTLCALCGPGLLNHPAWYLFGRSLLFHGMVLSLILGVGGRLLPGILGWKEIVSSQKIKYEGAPSFLKSVPLGIWLCAAVFLISFPLEQFAFSVLGRVLRSVVITYFAVTFWNVFRIPPNRTPHTIVLQISALCILGGSWAYALGGSLDLAGAHILFIGGFVLLTLMIASRVTAAHGEGTHIEKRPLPYFLPAIAILAAAATRFYAQLTPAAYLTHLGYAAVTFLVGMLLWNAFFLKKLWAKPR